MALVTTTYTVADSTRPIDLSTLGSLVHAAEVQYQRQLRTLQSLQKQAEQTAGANAAWQERERRREDKYTTIDMTRAQERAERIEAGNRVAEYRAARLDAAFAHEEAMRAAAAAKVRAVEDRLAAFAAERAEHAASERERIAALDGRRDATYRANLALLEARRQSMLERERRMEDILRQREELRQLQLRIRAEEDFVREQQRRAIKARADAELSGRVAHYHARNEAKDEYATRRKQEIEHLRAVRAEELRQRFDYIAAQANEAAAVAEAERQALAGRIGEKTARGEALAAQRQALLLEMQSLRQQMQRQEEVIRASLLRMRQKGSTAIPEEVVRALEAAEGGGPLRASVAVALTAGRSGSGGGGSPPRLMAAGAGAGMAGSPRGPGPARASGAGTRPRSAVTRTERPASPRNYLTAMLSPRVGQPGKARRVGGRGRPLSASAELRRSTTASPGEPPRAAALMYTAPGVVPYPVPYAPYVMPQPKPRGPKPPPPTVEEQVAASVRTTELAEGAVASGRYSAVHEVARPGSRREEELRGVLQEEIAKEGERQAMLAKVIDDAERARLVKYFTLEREEAKRRILALSNAAQAALYH
ncbi:hypothetical protein HYH03_014343 [Edaphochlamys debaryana]|uniref:Uncharacterized protein n=1 Tax=Edaphochlamys debaryana TaxID=47281 RepID=A0A836BS82_9CHLO|nr:hypothetical protein HYH03_014343 [Edaphochlamys debaryana]|eukprot:KAG2486970.1 hypothetical protein HYH03_014343 [Edaphochlamys debaryana]